MQTRMRLTVPDQAEATLTLTMSVKDWKIFKAQLAQDSWPSCNVFGAIIDIIDQAEKTVWEVQ